MIKFIEGKFFRPCRKSDIKEFMIVNWKSCQVLMKELNCRYRTDLIANSRVLYTGLNKLISRDRDALILRYGLHNNKKMAMKELKVLFGVTNGRMIVIEAKALRRLKDILIKDTDSNE